MFIIKILTSLFGLVFAIKLIKVNRQEKMKYEKIRKEYVVFLKDQNDSVTLKALGEGKFERYYTSYFVVIDAIDDRILKYKDAETVKFRHDYVKFAKKSIFLFAPALILICLAVCVWFPD